MSLQGLYDRAAQIREHGKLLGTWRTEERATDFFDVAGALYAIAYDRRSTCLADVQALDDDNAAQCRAWFKPQPRIERITRVQLFELWRRSLERLQLYTFKHGVRRPGQHWPATVCRKVNRCQREAQRRRAVEGGTHAQV